MAVSLTADCLKLEREFSPEEFSRHQASIDARRGRDYYHRIVIEDAAGKRLETPGIHPCLAVLALLDGHGFPRDLTDQRVLDIGCNAGFYAFAAKARGARAVVGVEELPHYFDQALLMREILGLDVELVLGDGYTIGDRFGTFDVVLNTGVIYHLQNPMEFLVKMAAITRSMMYVETEMLTDPAFADHAWFIEDEYCADRSNWWIYGPRCAERMLRAAGFPRVEFQGFVWLPPEGMKTPEGFLRQGRGVFVCRK